MSETQASLEGRLIAQRKLLIQLIAAHGDDPVGTALQSYLADRDHVELGSEDPGAVPDGAMAIEGAVAQELRLIREGVADAEAGFD